MTFDLLNIDRDHLFIHDKVNLLTKFEASTKGK